MPEAFIEPARNEAVLRDRVGRFFRGTKKTYEGEEQLTLQIFYRDKSETSIETPSGNVTNFLNFVSDALPNGDVYLFGGILRDLALKGKRGFNSDIDIVVEGEWDELITYILAKGAIKNKFGGYRLEIDKWPIDIWQAEETWAVKTGIVKYDGISSLTNTTVLNWDAILMNWRTKCFCCRKGYFGDLSDRSLDIVLEDNPNPLGMAVRVFRHILLKDAKKVSPELVKFLAYWANKFDYDRIKEAELKSYGNTVIPQYIFTFFKEVNISSNRYLDSRYSILDELMNIKLAI